MAMEPQDTTGTAPEPQLFLLRVWLERGGFRAALRRVGVGDPCVFTQPAELGEFLNHVLRPPAAGDGDLPNGRKR